MLITTDNVQDILGCTLRQSQNLHCKAPYVVKRLLREKGLVMHLKQAGRPLLWESIFIERVKDHLDTGLYKTPAEALRAAASTLMVLSKIEGK